MNNINIQEIIKDYDKQIITKRKRRNIDLTNEWVKQTPRDPGIYVIFKNKKIVYTGESGSIQGRMNDLRKTVNHTLRRSIGGKYFSKAKGFKKATSKMKFPPHIEKKIDNYICGLDVLFLPIEFGRKEMEEYLINKYKPIFNTKAKRGQ